MVASPRATTTKMSTVEHEYENANHVPYVPSSTTKLEEEGERGGKNLNPPLSSTLV